MYQIEASYTHKKITTKDITNKSRRWLSLIHTYSNDISNLTYFPTPKKKKKTTLPKKNKTHNYRKINTWVSKLNNYSKEREREREGWGSEVQSFNKLL